jgi:hypothetical protein
MYCILQPISFETKYGKNLLPQNFIHYITGVVDTGDYPFTFEYIPEFS